MSSNGSGGELHSTLRCCTPSALAPRMICAILTDIEGTVTPIRFVTDVFYPYARVRLPDFVRHRAADPEVSRIISEVQAEAGAKLDLPGVIA